MSLLHANTQQDRTCTDLFSIDFIGRDCRRTYMETPIRAEVLEMNALTCDLIRTGIAAADEQHVVASARQARAEHQAHSAWSPDRYAHRR